MCIVANQLGAKHACGFLVLSDILESRDVAHEGRRMRSGVACEPWNMLLLVLLKDEEHLKRRQQGEEAEGGGRGRERTGEDGRGEDLTVMESTAERGDGLREDKATFLKSYFLPRSLSW